MIKNLILDLLMCVCVLQLRVTSDPQAMTMRSLRMYLIAQILK